MSIEDVLRQHQVWIASDNAFQRRARLMQALWRERQDLPIGTHRGEPLGSRLEMPQAEAKLENYLTETIRAVVRREVVDPVHSAEKLYGRPRIFDDLLSSQPMCFNLFGELCEDLDLATEVFRRRMPERVERVTAVRFEHSPGRRDERFTGDRSAFDVFIEYTTPARAKAFVGIEVKYHEDLDDAPAQLRPRYEEIAAAMGAFREEKLDQLRGKPLQQIWRDHLLAGSMLQARMGYSEGLFVFLYPRDNGACEAALGDYRACLRDSTTFAGWILEEVIADVTAAGAGAWAAAFQDRYLGVKDLTAITGNGAPSAAW